LANYNRALIKLESTVALTDPEWDDEDLSGHFSELEKEGIIQRFEYIHELAWKVMKDYLEYQGNSAINGSRDATREAYKINLLQNAETWMDMIGSRNQTSHTYNDETAQEIFLRIIRLYYPEFIAFRDKMENLRNDSQTDVFSREI